VSDLPRPVADLCAALGAPEGIEAVTLGGSRAAGTADDASDWDIGLYYRGQVDLATLARYGAVHPPGSRGRIMNGGAWLTLEGFNRVAELALNRVVVGCPRSASIRAPSRRPAIAAGARTPTSA
jgi:hypothetical protein